MRKAGLILSIVSLFIFPQITYGLAPDPPGISLLADPEALEIAQGDSGTVTITGGSIGGFDDYVSLSLVDPPAEITATFDPNPFLVPGFDAGSAIMTIDVDTSAPLGDVELIVNAKGVQEDIDEQEAVIILTVIEGDNGSEPPNGSEPLNGSEVPNGNQTVLTTTVMTTVTTTLSTTVTTPSTVTSTVIIITRTPTVSTQTIDEDPTGDVLYPLLTLLIVVALLGIAAVSLRKSK
jgi:hypothetical protein